MTAQSKATSSTDSTRGTECPPGLADLENKDGERTRTQEDSPWQEAQTRNQKTALGEEVTVSPRAPPTGPRCSCRRAA